jgi:hypothetical protein
VSQALAAALSRLRSAAGEQIFAELRQALRALLGDAAPVARAVDERAPALGDRL